MKTDYLILTDQQLQFLANQLWNYVFANLDQFSGISFDKAGDVAQKVKDLFKTELKDLAQ